MSTDRNVVRLVVVFVGVATIIGLVGLIALVWHGGVDAGALAVVAGPTGTALGVLGAILAHTGSTPPSDPVPAAVVASSSPIMRAEAFEQAPTH